MGLLHAFLERVPVGREAGVRHRVALREQWIAQIGDGRQLDSFRGFDVAVGVDDQVAVPVLGHEERIERARTDPALDDTRSLDDGRRLGRDRSTLRLGRHQAAGSGRRRQATAASGGQQQDSDDQ